MGHFSTLIRAMGLAVTVALPLKAQDMGTVMATVNGTDITLGHMIALQERLPDQYKQLDDKTLFQGILDQLIQQTALSQAIEARQTKAQAIGLENETRAYLAGEFLAEIGTADVDEAQLKALYDEEFGNAPAGEEFSAAHILVETEDEAKALVVELESGADFAELAKEKSTGPSGPSGGDLGWFGLGQMVPEFEQAVVAMEDGAISDPIQTQFGWHVIKRNESRPLKGPTFEEARADLENQLRAEAIEAAIAGATDGAEVERVEIDLDPSIIRDLSLLAE